MDFLMGLKPVYRVPQLIRLDEIVNHNAQNLLFDSPIFRQNSVHRVYLTFLIIPMCFALETCSGVLLALQNA